MTAIADVRYFELLVLYNNLTSNVERAKNIYFESQNVSMFDNTLRVRPESAKFIVLCWTLFPFALPRKKETKSPYNVSSMPNTRNRNRRYVDQKFYYI